MVLFVCMFNITGPGLGQSCSIELHIFVSEATQESQA